MRVCVCAKRGKVRESNGNRQRVLPTSIVGHDAQTVVIQTRTKGKLLPMALKKHLAGRQPDAF